MTFHDDAPALAAAQRVDEIVNVLEDANMPYANEEQLQYRIATALAAAGIRADREVRLSDGFSRIDIMSGDVGIEVKIAGQPGAVHRQLARYSACPEISALILVTTRPEQRIENDGAPEFNGKLVRSLWVKGAGL
ncbi:hypothetical protein [Microbacterium arborescens]